jgi:endonuclease/exonuclease/phosphatase family metal-dependent hydrolase
VWQALQRLAGDASAVPVVVGGDFNAPWPGPAAPTHWAGDVPLRASPCAAGKATARSADGTALDLDHVLLGPAWTDAQRAQARTHVALPPWAVAPQDAASDHAAVVLDVDWPRLA